jgi:hypothetical protein
MKTFVLLYSGGGMQESEAEQDVTPSSAYSNPTTP